MSELTKLYLKIIELRDKGLTYSKIQKQLKCSKPKILYAIKNRETILKKELKLNKQQQLKLRNKQLVEQVAKEFKKTSDNSVIVYKQYKLKKIIYKKDATIMLEQEFKKLKESMKKEKRETIKDLIFLVAPKFLFSLKCTNEIAYKKAESFAKGLTTEGYTFSNEQNYMLTLLHSSSDVNLKLVNGLIKLEINESMLKWKKSN